MSDRSNVFIGQEICLLVYMSSRNLPHPLQIHWRTKQ